MIDRSLKARNVGKFVIDEKDSGEAGADEWLHSAAVFLPKDRVVLDTTTKVLYDLTDVIAYAGWGSNDTNRHRDFSASTGCRGPSSPSSSPPMRGRSGSRPIPGKSGRAGVAQGRSRAARRP